MSKILIIEDEVAIDLQQSDINLLNGKDSIQKVLLINRLRLIIENDYTNFINYIEKQNII